MGTHSFAYLMPLSEGKRALLLCRKAELLATQHTSSKIHRISIGMSFILFAYVILVRREIKSMRSIE